MAIRQDFSTSPFEQPDPYWCYERKTRSFPKRQAPGVNRCLRNDQMAEKETQFGFNHEDTKNLIDFGHSDC